MLTFFVDCLAAFCFFWRLRKHVSLINFIFQSFNFLLPRLWGVGSEKIQRFYGGTYDWVKKIDNNKCQQGCGEIGMTYTTGRIISCAAALGNSLMVSQKFQLKVSI